MEEKTKSEKADIQSDSIPEITVELIPEEKPVADENESNEEKESDEMSENNKEGKGFFGKKKKSVKKEKDNEVVEKLTAQLREVSEKHIRLAAEFDNYKKRTLKEKSDLLKYGAEAALKNILPVVDDFERGLKSMENIPDDEPVKAGILLIYNKFKEYLTRNGIKEMECKNGIFNVDEHEAITRFPAPSEELKGKIIDVVEKGYFYHDKVLRFAKVVIGE